MDGVPPLYHAVVAAASGLAAQCTVPFIGEDGDFVRLEGTGTLFQFDDLHVVVTAAHVAEQINALGLGIPIGTSRAAIWRPQGGQVHTAGDPFDIAILELDDAHMVEALKRAHRFLTLQNVLLRDSPRLLDFYVQGFPSASARYERGHLTGVPFGYATRRYQGLTNIDGLHVPVDPKIHLLLAHEERGVDARGEKLELPAQLGGISG